VRHCLAAVAIAVSLAACGSDSSPTPTSPTIPTPTTSTPASSTPPSGTYVGTLTDQVWGTGTIRVVMNWNTATSYTGTWSTTLSNTTNTGSLQGNVAVITTARPLDLTLFLQASGCSQATMTQLSLDEAKITPRNQVLSYPGWNRSDCINAKLPSSGTVGTLTKQ
jgi:hypothetical protein